MPIMTPSRDRRVLSRLVTLIRTTDEDIATRQKWLSATEYDSQTRNEIDALWEKVEKEDMWFMLGARMKKHTIISHVDDQWTLVNDKRRDRAAVQ